MIDEKEIEKLRKAKSLLKAPLLLEENKQLDEPITHKEWKEEIKRVSSLMTKNGLDADTCPTCKRKLFGEDTRAWALHSKGIDLYNRENPKLNRVSHKTIRLSNPRLLSHNIFHCSYKINMDEVYYCENCQNYHIKSDISYKEYASMAGGYYCCDFSTRSRTSLICSKCGKYYYQYDNAIPNLCPYCSSQQRVNNYNYKPKPKFIVTEEEKNTKRFFGMEYEVGISTTNASKFMQRINDNAVNNTSENLCYLKHDGSVDGFEVVTHPHSLTALKFFVIESLLPTLLHYRHHFTNCGIHIHVSKKSLSKATIIKLCLLFNNVIDRDETTLLCNLCHRTEDRLARWSSTRCGMPNIQNMTNLSRTNSQHLIYRGNKYIACNLNHNDTIEFRMFGGTDEQEKIISFIEMIDGAINFCEVTPYSKITIKNWLDFLFNNYKQYPNTYNRLKNNTLFSSLTITDNGINDVKFCITQNGYPVLTSRTFEKCFILLYKQTWFSNDIGIKLLVDYYKSHTPTNKFYIGLSLLQVIDRIIDGDETPNKKLIKDIIRWIKQGCSFALAEYELSTNPILIEQLCKKHKEVILCA